MNASVLQMCYWRRLMFDRNFINCHVSILDPVYEQHTVNKSTYFCMWKKLHYKQFKRTDIWRSTKGKRMFGLSLSYLNFRVLVEADYYPHSVIWYCFQWCLCVGACLCLFVNTITLEPLLLNRVFVYIQTAVFMSAKSVQYIEILRHGRKQTSRIQPLTSDFLVSGVRQ